MPVTLKLFTTYRRHLPPGSVGNACELHAPAGTPVSDLLARFGVPHEPGASVILVNGRDASLERTLEAGDVVAAFPAMAGG